jgi:hypothetical protein
MLGIMAIFATTTTCFGRLALSLAERQFGKRTGEAFEVVSSLAVASATAPFGTLKLASEKVTPVVGLHQTSVGIQSHATNRKTLFPEAPISSPQCLLTPQKYAK